MLTNRITAAIWVVCVPDANTTLGEMRELVRQFVDERDWRQFHSPKNIAMGVAVEAAELMECFLWVDLPGSYEAANDPQKREAIADEMADVFCYLLAMSNVIGLDLGDALRAKMVKNIRKYPADTYQGKYQLEK